MRAHYVPLTKIALLKWFKEYRPSWKVSHMKKRQLYAVFFGEMRKEVEEIEKNRDEGNSFSLSMGS